LLLIPQEAWARAAEEVLHTSTTIVRQTVHVLQTIGFPVILCTTLLAEKDIDLYTYDETGWCYEDVNESIYHYIVDTGADHK